MFIPTVFYNVCYIVLLTYGAQSDHAKFTYFTTFLIGLLSFALTPALFFLNRLFFSNQLLRFSWTFPSDQPSDTNLLSKGCCPICYVCVIPAASRSSFIAEIYEYFTVSVLALLWSSWDSTICVQSCVVII